MIPTFIGKNPNFKASFNPISQAYTVSYKGKYMTTEYRFRDIETYLN